MQKIKMLIKSVVRLRKFLTLRPRFRPRFGNLRRVEPVSTQFGYDRGTPIDRYYIEKFLREESNSITGNVVEIGDNSYTKKYATETLLSSDVIHISDSDATYVTDLATDKLLPSNYYNCAIVTQTLHCIYDARSALRNIYKTLSPGGILLLTVPGISQLSSDQWSETWSWSFTKYSLMKIALEAGFDNNNCILNSYGNVLSSSAFLYGLALEDLKQEELDYVDDRYQQLLTLRALK